MKVQGFDVDRLYLSAPGGGWIVMDTLDMEGRLGGAMALTTGYAHGSLRVGGAPWERSVEVVSDLATADFGFAVTYDRFRFYLDLDSILEVDGNGGTVGPYEYSAPGTGAGLTPSGVNPNTAPDTLGDARIGLDLRWMGSARGTFRLGTSAQLFVPSSNTNRGEYITDGIVRAMLRLLGAGDVGCMTYAAQLGVHIRPLDDAPAPGSPEGAELLFGAAAGPRLDLTASGATTLVVGPEIFGETALRGPLRDASGVEALLSARLEVTAENGPRITAKAGMGGRVEGGFGAPAWRAVLGIEISDRLGGIQGRP